jgi:hypothetical protein
MESLSSQGSVHERAAECAAHCTGSVGRQQRLGRRNNGARPGSSDAPLDYRLRFPALKMTTSAAATSTAVTTLLSKVRFRNPTGST